MPLTVKSKISRHFGMTKGLEKSQGRGIQLMRFQRVICSENKRCTNSLVTSQLLVLLSSAPDILGVEFITDIHRLPIVS
jgi:hypothetical protein